METRYVLYGSAESIIAHFAAPQPGLTLTEVPDTDPGLVAFDSAPPPSPPPSPLAWLMRLSQATQLELIKARKVDDEVDLAMTLASGVSYVDVTDPLTIQSVQMLHSKFRADGVTPLISDTEVTTLLDA